MKMKQCHMSYIAHYEVEVEVEVEVLILLFLLANYCVIIINN